MTKQVEVITSVQRRRRRSRAEKERIVSAALESGAVASEVARAAGIHTSQLFRWKATALQTPAPTRLILPKAFINSKRSLAAHALPDALPCVRSRSAGRGKDMPTNDHALFADISLGGIRSSDLKPKLQPFLQHQISSERKRHFKLAFARELRMRDAA
jgi:hypothetical protein